MARGGASSVPRAVDRSFVTLGVRDVRLGVICQGETANAHYRAILPMRELERRGHTVLWPGAHSYAEALAGVPNWDLLHIHQFIGADDLATVQRLRREGVAVVWDTDDDPLSVPKGSESYRRHGGKRKLKRIFEQTVAMARAAHLMTTTSEGLAAVYRSAGVEHVAVIENHLAPGDPDGKRRRRPGIVIGCTAANEHARDIEGLRISQTLRAIQAAHPEVQVVALGVDLKLDPERYVHSPSVPIGRLLEIERDFDIALAPLVDHPFNHARSNVKLKEYAAAGAAWLASPVGPFVGMGEQQGGLLVADGDWHEAIEGLVLDYRRRSELAQQGRAWARTQTIRHGGDAWETAFKGAILRARRERG